MIPSYLLLLLNLSPLPLCHRQAHPGQHNGREEVVQSLILKNCLSALCPGSACCDSNVDFDIMMTKVNVPSAKDKCRQARPGGLCPPPKVCWLILAESAYNHYNVGAWYNDKIHCSHDLGEAGWRTKPRLGWVKFCHYNADLYAIIMTN